MEPLTLKRYVCLCARAQGSQNRWTILRYGVEVRTYRISDAHNHVMVMTSNDIYVIACRYGIVGVPASLLLSLFLAGWFFFFFLVGSEFSFAKMQLVSKQ